jgi:xanthine dehydrogenase small subunit
VSVRFLLDGAIIEAGDVDPTTTVLQFLRRTLRRTGTKEGCAEGDCGACTVAVGELCGETIRYRAINSCIAFLPTLDGRDLVTVESLSAQGRSRSIVVRDASTRSSRRKPGPRAVAKHAAQRALDEDLGPGLRRDERVLGSRGTESVTIEAPAGMSGDGPELRALHPAQQAMVDCHGSQCGFCTPGFVMSLFVHYENRAPTDEAALCTALAGNLCRCTGYGPILAAGRRMVKARAARRSEDPDSIRKLKTIQRRDDLALTVAGKRYFAPRSLPALLALRAQHPDAVLVAGATDVGLWVTKLHRNLGTVIALNEVGELKSLEERDGGLLIGAAVPYADAESALARRRPDFAEVLRRLGSVQIRNSGTIGGNIANASPIGDSMPLLIAAGARLHLRSAGGAREMPLEDFFIAYGKKDLKPDEIVEAVFLPRLADDVHFRAYKISKRYDQDISALCGAFALKVVEGRILSARIAFGGMAATPARARAAEAALAGAAFTRAAAEQAAAALDRDFTPISDLRASAGYRSAVAKNLLLKAFLEWEGAETRVAHG